ncbi:hypothetical protein [Arthrobacter sp. zg-Y877]|uniref:hypothetical protein n=1 Tax=Arthrobacter sp. zg-Y877 TaxID=3049074 RepID=UPI0025A4448A|nr:hypothetical protein [Arthrobacter sp. zg-Y877]MDM7989609.1 hypothetical protein [Arthrobacter sp. zg-Y877]
MTFTLMSWILAAWLVLTCLSVAVPVWKRAGQPSGPSRRSLLAGLMEAASLTGLLRLVVPWSPGSVALWVVAIVVLASAVAGAVLRWPELPGRGSESVGPAGEAGSEASTGPEDAEQEAWDHTRRPQAAAAKALPSDPSLQPGLPARGTPHRLDADKPRGKVKAGKSGRKAAGGKKKEPGNLALTGHVALLVAVIVLSFLVG